MSAISSLPYGTGRQAHLANGQLQLRDLLASKVSVVDGIKDVSEHIQFGSLILKNSGDMVASVFWSATSLTSSMPSSIIDTT